MNKIPFLGQLDTPFAVYFDCAGRPPRESDLQQRYRDWVWENTVEPLRSALLAPDHQPEIDVLARDEAPEIHLSHCTDPARVARLTAARWVAFIDGSEGTSELRPLLWATLGAALAVGDALNGEIYDLTTSELVSRRPQLPTDGRVRLSEHMNALFSVAEDGRGWLTTKGMSKFGSPELQMVGIRPHDVREMHALIQACADRMWTRVLKGELDIPPAFELSSADLGLSGDGLARVGLRYDGPSKPGASSFLTLLPEPGVIDELWGDRSHEISVDPELLEQAHQRAVDELGAVGRRFARGLPPGTTLSVKVGFLDPDSPGRVDFMWVRVRSWKGQRITGWVEDDEVELSPDDVFDWLLESLDGRREGGYTDAILAEWS